MPGPTYYFQRSGVRLFVRDHGEGRPVVLLHGWPDTGALWDDVTPHLLAAGLRLVAPDQRGCGLSDKPGELDAYRAHELVFDVAELIESLDAGPVSVVGHDWGSAIGWALCRARPDLVSRFVALSVGHPRAFYSGGVAQQVRSWYMMMFAHEGVGEKFLRLNSHEAIRTWMGHPRAEEIITELERDGQLEAQLRWYRANVPVDVFVSGILPEIGEIEVPVLGVWSSRDFALSEDQMRDSAQYCPAGFSYVRLEDAGHWIPYERPRELASEIVNFLHSSPLRRAGESGPLLEH